MLQAAWNHIHKLFTGYYNLLLFSIVLLFIFRPYGGSFVYLAIWKLLLTTVFLSTVFNSNHARPVRIITGTLVVPMLI